MDDFTVHLLFSPSGAHACADYVREVDRVAVMSAVEPEQLLALRKRVACVRVISSDSGLDAGIDYPTLVHWCCECARVISWR